MGIEELKLILETVEGVSDSAIWVVCLWFGVGVVKNLISASMFGMFFVLLYKCANKMMSTIMLGGMVADRLGEDYYGLPSQRSKILEKLNRALNKTS